MAKPNVDYGQAEIQVFGNAAAEGVVQYDHDVAQQAAQVYDRAIIQLTDIRMKLGAVTEAKGFGGFQTGQELQAGFSNKARDGIEVITQLIDGAMRLQEVYLRAGGLIAEADQVNGKRLQLLSDSDGMGKS